MEILSITVTVEHLVVIGSPSTDVDSWRAPLLGLSQLLYK